MKLRFQTVPFALFMIAIAAPAVAGDSKTIATRDGRLAHPLVLKDVQGGFAGFTGQSYRIAPDGTWSLTRVFNERKFKPTKTGKLTPDQMKSLIATLASNKLLQLPKTSGGRPQVNPHVMTITFGKKVVKIQLTAGLDKARDLPRGAAFDAARRVFAIRKAIRELTGLKSPDSKS